MKRLIHASNIEDFISSSGNSIYVDKDTIITPSAIDRAEQLGIEIVYKKEKSNNIDFNSEKIYSLLKQLIEKGMIDNLFPNYEFEENKKGFKLIRGNTVKSENMKKLDCNKDVSFQKLIGREGQSLKAGFMEINSTKFSKKAKKEEILYVMEGNVSLEIDDKKYSCNGRDVIQIPKESKFILETNEKVKIFYLTV